MLRRLKFFLAGALLSILVLSMGPENRLKDTFIAYIEYFDPDKRIIRQLVISDSIQISSEANIKLLSEVYHGIDYSLNHDTFNIQQVENYLEKIYSEAWINHNLSNKESYPQVFILETDNIEEGIQIKYNFYDNELKKDSSGKLVRYTKSELLSFKKGVDISSRSYKSYYLLLGMFIIVMLPVSLLVRRLVIRRRLKED